MSSSATEEVKKEEGPEVPEKKDGPAENRQGQQGGPASGPAPSRPPHGPGSKEADEFSEYMWMEHMDKYDEEVLKQLEEDALIMHYTDLFEDSLLEDGSAGPNTANLVVSNGSIYPPAQGGGPFGEDNNLEDDMSRQFSQSMNLSSRLNPNAAEFVPKAYTQSSFGN